MISLIIFWNIKSTDAVVISSSSKVTFAYVLFYYAIQNFPNTLSRKRRLHHFRNLPFLGDHLKSIFSWTVAYNISQFFNFFEFVDLYLEFGGVGTFFVYILCTKVAPPVLFNEMNYLSKKRENMNNGIDL